MIMLAILVILGTIFQGMAMFRSGIFYDFGIGYWGPLARDGVWHEALTSSLIKSFPPQNPGLSGELLINYHYFFDFLVAKISQFLSFSPRLLIYYFFPIIFSVLLGIGTYKLSMILFKDKKTSLLSVFFAYFASSFGWIVDLVKNRQIGGESAFWANQPVSMNLNPPFAISLVIIIFTILLVDSYIKTPKAFKAVGIIFLAGILIGFKVYAGGIFLAGFLVLGLKRLIFDKDFKLILISIFSILLSLIIFIPQNKASLGLVEIKPFWLIDTMIDAADRVGIPDLSSKRFTYGGSGQWLKFYIVEAIGLLIFFIGNLGTRMVGILGLKKEQFKNDLFIFIFVMMAVSLVPPFIFVQKGNPWNIVQFFYYFLYFSGLFAAYGLKKLPLVLAILVVLITPISSVATFRSWLYPNPPAYLSTKEYEALKYLSNQEGGVVLKHPFDSNLRSKFKDPFPLSVYADNAYVAAFSGKPVFIEDVEQQIVLNTNYKAKLDNVRKFFTMTDLIWSIQFLKDNDVKYIYLPKIYKFPLSETEYPITKIFENEDATIYMINKL